MKSEFKVGLIFIFTIALVIGFASYLGVLNPMAKSHKLTVLYNFAGGIEVGSPVRVMGIKVGKVKDIVFDSEMKSPDGEEVKLKLIIAVEKKAWNTIRKDSSFYINLAGVIGEKFLEITPGSTSAEEFQPDDVVRGIDPPRIDQLISQGYGLAGKILEVVEKNEGSVVDVINKLSALLTNFTKTLEIVDKTLSSVDKTAKNKELKRLFKNVVQISDDLVVITGGLKSKESKETVELVKKLIKRLEDLDGPAIKKFFQEEGIKAKIF